MSSLDKSILSTIVYYDVLGLPLTTFEGYKYLINPKKPVSFSNISDALENSEMLKRYLDHQNGFYFLKGRVDIVRERIKKEKIIQEKWKKCKKAIKLLEAVSFLKAVALSGSMAVGNASRASDIDLLIVARIGRIWTTRLLVTILLSILGARRHGRFIKDRVCLNHYITDASLRIKFPSLYNAQTYVHLIPVLGDINLFNRFKKENAWIKNWVYPELVEGASGSSGEENLKYIKPSLFFKSFARLGELVLSGRRGDFIERILARWQRKMIMRSSEKNEVATFLVRQSFSLGGRSRSGSRITIDNTQLEFHPDSPEAWIISKYNKKMEGLGFPEMAQEKDSGLDKI